jgi:hypothetical protein
MWTFLFGAFLAVLPKRWRQSLPFRESINWRIAATLSGFMESVAALIAIAYWYSYSMNTWVSRALDAALAGKMGESITTHDIGFTALVVFATHPLTWLIAYFGLEGSVRFVGGAFTGNLLGILPLFVLDKILLKTTGRSGPSVAQAAGFTQGNISSYLGAVREKVRAVVPDELCVSKEQAEEFLEIRACRRKPDWTPPRTVRYQDAFYRLEASSEGWGPRPFRYCLRRLSAGVMGRTVLIYSPEETPILSEK